MPYIVKSSLDIAGKIIPWNEQEANKLIKEKEKKLKEMKKEVKEEVKEEIKEEPKKEDAKKQENASYKRQDAYMPLKKNKKKDKAGEE